MKIKSPAKTSIISGFAQYNLIKIKNHLDIHPQVLVHKEWIEGIIVFNLIKVKGLFGEDQFTIAQRHSEAGDGNIILLRLKTESQR